MNGYNFWRGVNALSHELHVLSVAVMCFEELDRRLICRTNRGRDASCTTFLEKLEAAKSRLAIDELTPVSQSSNGAWVGTKLHEVKSVELFECCRLRISKRGLRIFDAEPFFAQSGKISAVRCSGHYKSW
jgi:hypothetical protein